MLKITTLAIAFSVSIVVTLFSINEFGYDTSHDHVGDVFRLLAHNTDKNYTSNRLSASIPDSVLRSIGKQFTHLSTISRIKGLKKVTVITDGNYSAYDQKIHAAIQRLVKYSPLTSQMVISLTSKVPGRKF